MITILTRAAVCFLSVGAVVLYGSYKAGRNDPERPRSLAGRIFRVGGVWLGVCLLVLLAKKTYLGPRYGGILGYITEGMAAGSAMRQVEGSLGQMQSALSIYYGDTEGKYPATLDVLWQDQKYLTAAPHRADVYLEAGNGKWVRAHWYRDTNQIKTFSSRAQSDDSGGWGYVGDPKSPEWGTVFVNCTHPHWMKKVPWNLLGKS